MRFTSFLTSMKQRLLSSSGETMVETLVSVLISALALMLLSTAIGSSVNIVLSSKDSMEKRYADESAMVAGGEKLPGTPKVTVQVPLETPVPGSGTAMPIDVFGSSETDLYLYRRP